MPSVWTPGDALQNSHKGMDGADNRSRSGTVGWSVDGASQLGLLASWPSGARLFDCAGVCGCQHTSDALLDRRCRRAAELSPASVTCALNVAMLVAEQLSAADFDSHHNRRLAQSPVCYERRMRCVATRGGCSARELKRPMGALHVCVFAACVRVHSVEPRGAAHMHVHVTQRPEWPEWVMSSWLVCSAGHTLPRVTVLGPLRV